MQAALYAEAWVDSSAGTCPTGLNKRSAWYLDRVSKWHWYYYFLFPKKKVDGVHQPHQTFKKVEALSLL